MTTRDAADTWSTYAEHVERWCHLAMVPATRTAQGWHLPPDARPPYRHGSQMILAWMATSGARTSVFEADLHARADVLASGTARAGASD